MSQASRPHTPPYGDAADGLRQRRDELSPIDDPYLTPRPPPAPRGEVTPLALAALVLSALGPVGALCAVVFGWAARRELDVAHGPRRGRGLATAAMVLGAVLAIVETAALGAYLWRRNAPESALLPVEEVPTSEVVDPAGAAAPSTAPAPAPQPARPPAGGTVPKNTKVQRAGAVTAVDVGVSVGLLSEELARQRAEAARAGETLVVMTTTDDCGPCRNVNRHLTDRMMQTALAKVRLVRVDVYVFDEDLTALKIPHDRIPGFYVLGLDLTPKDGIDGGEWDDDIPPNMAPVLGAFVRGNYTARRNNWQPPPSTGIRL